MLPFSDWGFSELLRIFFLSSDELLGGAYALYTPPGQNGDPSSAVKMFALHNLEQRSLLRFLYNYRKAPKRPHRQSPVQISICKHPREKAKKKNAPPFRQTPPSSLSLSSKPRCELQRQSSRKLHQRSLVLPSTVQTSPKLSACLEWTWMIIQLHPCCSCGASCVILLAPLGSWNVKLVNHAD